MTYRATIVDILYLMIHEAWMDPEHGDGVYTALGDGFAEATLTEAGKFAEPSSRL